MTEKDIQDGKKIAELFAILSEENKNIAMGYLSALRDKELADSKASRRMEDNYERNQEKRDRNTNLAKNKSYHRGGGSLQ